jgi:hypothetical protein
MNSKDVLDRYITVLGVKDVSGCIIRGYPLPKQLGFVIVEIGHPSFYHKGNSIIDFPVYIDINYTRAECGFWFISFEKYFGIDLMDIAVLMTTKFNEHKDSLQPVLSNL